jgi:hypothetical protein
VLLLLLLLLLMVRVVVVQLLLQVRGRWWAWMARCWWSAVLHYSVGHLQMVEGRWQGLAALQAC